MAERVGASVGWWQARQQQRRWTAGQQRRQCGRSATSSRLAKLAKAAHPPRRARHPRQFAGAQASARPRLWLSGGFAAARCIGVTEPQIWPAAARTPRCLGPLAQRSAPPWASLQPPRSGLSRHCPHLPLPAMVVGRRGAHSACYLNVAHVRRLPAAQALAPPSASASAACSHEASQPWCFLDQSINVIYKTVRRAR